MRSFWISLLVFILLMCSCKSKEVATSFSKGLQLESDVSYMNETVKADTTKTTYTEQLSENTVIKETIITTEYDKDTGAVAKETKTEREIRQGSDKVVTEEESKGVSEVTKDSLNHFRDITKKVDVEIEEETTGGQEAFGKWFGIVLGTVIGLLIVYLLNKFRVN